MSEITETQQQVLWSFFGVAALMTSVILSIAFCNVRSMLKNEMKRVLIVLLYITCALREVLSAAVIFKYAYDQRIDLLLHVQVTRWLTSAFSLADTGLIVTVILTNFQLATSMQ